MTVTACEHNCKIDNNDKLQVIQVCIFHVRHNNNIIKYTILSVNTFKSFWLHVSTALRPSSGQHIQIKCLQYAYNMGFHSVYNCNVCNITTIKTYMHSGYITITHITIVHTMGSHIVRKLKALNNR